MIAASEMTVGTNDESRPAFWSGKDVLLMTVATIAAVVIGVAIVAGATMALGGPTEAGGLPAAASVGILAVQGVAMLGAVWLIGVRRRGHSWADIGMRRTTPGWIVASIGIFFVMRIAVVLLVALLAQLGLTSMQAQAFAPAGLTAVSALSMLFFAGLIVPIAEEVFFRGVVYRWMRDKWGVAIGVVVSGVVFGVAHLEPATAIPAAILGMVLALVFEKSKSLWPSILIHALNNTLAIGLLYLLMASGAEIPGLK